MNLAVLRVVVTLMIVLLPLRGLGFLTYELYARVQTETIWLTVGIPTTFA